MRKLFDPKFDINTLSKVFFVIAMCAIAFSFGFVAHRYKIFPYSLIEQAFTTAKKVYMNITHAQKGVYENDNYRETDYSTKIPVFEKEDAYNNLSLITSIIEDSSLSVSVIDMDGQTIHEWDIDWFDIWPDPTHIPKDDRRLPKGRPGTHVHGVVLLENGDIIFNFDFLGMVRLDVCGKVIWRLEYRTHHSIYKDEYNNLWVPGQINHTEPLPDLPNFKPPFIEPTVIKVNLEGEILEEISIIDLFQENGLQGLLYMPSIANRNTAVSGDTLHLNDVETFPSFMEDGIFKAGDIMVSLRNIHAIVIFSETDLKIKHMSIGEFVRQHDPDFIDGYTISVLDNNLIAPEDYGHQSRIIIKSFLNDQSYAYFSGNEAVAFYTEVMGNHEWLPNGNLLITESDKGRAFEIDQQGNIVWEFVNIVADGYAGRVEDASRLPDTFTKEFFDQITDMCDATD
ncbi:arylsulfotransferase family protein [Chloroflexota bacterium]